MAGDLGYGDVSCYGARSIKTPHIDQLAAEGLHFTNGHCSASTCTPTRYSFLTGTYAFRNDVSRIGFYTGGHAARFRDQDLADKWVEKSAEWIEANKDGPFFLFFSSHDLHVPRLPHERFAGATPHGPRGDSIVQLDWCVGELMKTPDRLKLAEQTLIVFCSDNGPVMDDGPTRTTPSQKSATTARPAHSPAANTAFTKAAPAPLHHPLERKHRCSTRTARQSRRQRSLLAHRTGQRQCRKLRLP